MNSTIVLRNLTKKFGKLEAVKDVSFNVNKGEVFGLLGPNGAGKTTAIRIITTLLPPTCGEVWVEGYSVTKQGSIVRRNIGYVPQALSADSTLTGYENLLFIAKLLRLKNKEREDKINYVLNILNLKDMANRLVREYSGGMVRKLEIGQAIIHEPRVLILDEPTIGLDPIARHNVWEVLHALKEETGLTILITTHYMEEAEAICNRVAIMNRGQIAAIGTSDELKAKTGIPKANLEDVFTFFTGNQLESGGSFRETRQLRRRIQKYN